MELNIESCFWIAFGFYLWAIGLQRLPLPNHLRMLFDQAGIERFRKLFFAAGLLFITTGIVLAFRLF